MLTDCGCLYGVVCVVVGGCAVSGSVGERLVVVRNVSKEFRRDQLVIPVLNGMNLELEAGGYLALMGPSGSGKTTLLNLIAGLD
ncbi:MAG: ATP-binding cassette domain-containing protein, partial [Planctomycetaceae bacterium]